MCATCRLLRSGSFSPTLCSIFLHRHFHLHWSICIDNCLCKVANRKLTIGQQKCRPHNRTDRKVINIAIYHHAFFNSRPTMEQRLSGIINEMAVNNANKWRAVAIIECTLQATLTPTVAWQYCNRNTVPN